MMNNEYIEWLLSSLPEEIAVAPFTTEFYAMTSLITLNSVDNIIIDWQSQKASMPDCGKILFVWVDKGVLCEQQWDHAFRMCGTSHNREAEHEFMSALLRRVKYLECNTGD